MLNLKLRFELHFVILFAMRDYEMVVVVNAQLTTAKQKTFLDNIGKVVGLFGGKLDETSDWGKRDLAYPIKKQKEANYFLLNFKLPPNQVFALDQKVKLTDNVLRHLIIAKRAGQKAIGKKK